jgi:xeroderma pigmentosum group C-complementing protein
VIVEGYGRDVTRRYAKGYFAKTWRLRVEGVEGEGWWRRVMRYLDRDEPLVLRWGVRLM